MRSVVVANPIYDVVFTYLMQDQRVARLLIGRITGLAVQSLTVSPQETAVRRTPEDPEHDLPLTLLRMDFAARGRSGRSAQLPYGRRRHTGGQPPHLEGGCRVARRWLAARAKIADCRS